jgi:hypothetical protein
MTAPGLKRVLFIVLLLAFAGVWLYNLTLFLPSSEATYFRTATDEEPIPPKTKEASLFNLSWGYKLEEPLPDPFVPFYNNATPPKDSLPVIIPEIVIDQPYQYIGLIKGKRKNCGILRHRSGDTYVVVPGDTLSMTTILKVNEKYIEFKFQDKIFKLELNEPAGKQ